MGCSLLREERYDEASLEFQKAKQRKETSTLLFGEALIAYKSNKRAKAIEIIRKANEKNLYYVSIGKYLEKWSEGRVSPVKPSQTHCN